MQKNQKFLISIYQAENENPEPICKIDGNILKIGEIIRQGGFDIQCNLQSSDITACYFMDEQGKERKLAVGQAQETERWVHFCNRDEKNPNKISYQTERKKIKYNSKIKNE